MYRSEDVRVGKVDGVPGGEDDVADHSWERGRERRRGVGKKNEDIRGKY